MKKIVDMEKWHQYYKFVMNFYDERYQYEYGYMDATDNIDDWLDAQPNAEEKRGKWKLEDHEYVYYANCSYCNESFLCDGEWDYDSWEKYMAYCPNCGAKMDLGEDEWK